VSITGPAAEADDNSFASVVVETCQVGIKMTGRKQRQQTCVLFSHKGSIKHRGTLKIQHDKAVLFLRTTHFLKVNTRLWTFILSSN